MPITSRFTRSHAELGACWPLPAGLNTLDHKRDRWQPEGKRRFAMYTTVGLVAAMILVVAAPIIWVASRLIADTGETAATGSVAHHEGPDHRHQWAA
jgi:hypothetical protein